MVEDGVARDAVWAVMDKPGVELYSVLFTLRAYEEDGQYVSVCDELDVASCGDTIDEALDNVTEATICYLNTIEALGERRDVFRERGIEPKLGPPADADAYVLGKSVAQALFRGEIVSTRRLVTSGV